MSTAPVGPIALVATRVRTEERMLLKALHARRAPVAHVDDRSLVYTVGAPPPWRAVLNRALSATRRREVGRLCEAAGVPVLNTPRTLDLCDNKVATAWALHASGVPTPRTAVALDVSAGAEALEAVGLPAVTKPVNGSWGRGVARLADADAAEAVFALRAQLPSPVQRVGYVQEYVPGRDLRVLVVGDRAVAAMAREGDHWVRNTARGARPVPLALDADLASLAERAAAAVGGGVLGVDLLETPQGERLVLEVNAAPEFHGLAEAHPDLPVADLIAGYFLDAVSAAETGAEGTRSTAAAGDGAVR